MSTIDRTKPIWRVTGYMPAPDLRRMTCFVNGWTASDAVDAARAEGMEGVSHVRPVKDEDIVVSTTEGLTRAPLRANFHGKPESSPAMSDPTSLDRLSGMKMTMTVRRFNSVSATLVVDERTCLDEAKALFDVVSAVYVRLWMNAWRGSETWEWMGADRQGRDPRRCDLATRGMCGCDACARAVRGRQRAET